MSVVHTVIFLSVSLDFVIDVTIRGERSDCAYHNASLCAKERDPARFSSTVLSHKTFAMKSRLREIYLPPRHVARFARRGSSAYRIKHAPKLQLKLSVSIRTCLWKKRGRSARKSRRIMQGYLNELRNR